MKRIFCLVVTVAALVSGCSGGSSSSNSGQSKAPTIGDSADPAIVEQLPFLSRSFEMGTAGYTPPHYPASSEEDWRMFFEELAASYGGWFGVHINPNSDKDENDILVQVRLAYEEVKNVEPYIELAVNFEDGPFTDERGEELIRVAVANAEKYHPKYLSLGVEINSFYLFHPDSFDLYVSYARAAYDQIKAVSPNTQVMNNFQLERMKGETDLTGESFASHWDVIDKFTGKIDAVSFTVYPFLHRSLVGDIPDNYLSEIREHTDLPVLITETGWPTVDLISGVNGSDQDQVDYMLKLSGQANLIDVRVIIWVFPVDAEFGLAGGIFGSLSLHDNGGIPKPAYEYWKAINALPQL